MSALAVFTRTRISEAAQNDVDLAQASACFTYERKSLKSATLVAERSAARTYVWPTGYGSKAKEIMMTRNTLYLAIPAAIGVAAALTFAAAPAQAHCDAIDGPVAMSAVRALDQNNVNVVLPYVQPAAETELTAAFKQAITVRNAGPDAKALAERHFMETAVRLHRRGEGASYEGLKPAGTDFGPAIPAAEAAIARGTPDQVKRLLSDQLTHGIEARFEHVLHAQALPKEPKTATEVVAARERAHAELEFVQYVEGIYAATQGSAHAE
jgi:hypothetical protein